MSMRKRKEVQKLLRKTQSIIIDCERLCAANYIKDAERLEVAERLLSPAAEVLRSGGLVAFPTETVYGLGANALDPAAVKRIYEAKGRPSDNPLIVHIASIEDLKPLVKNVPPVAETLMSAFWPGPLTLVFEKSNIVPYETSGGLDTVAVRFPQNMAARLLIKQTGLPIAAPSANTSGKPSPTRADHVAADLDGKIDVIVDGGDCTIGLESTVLDVSGEMPVLLRPGSVTREMIEDLIGHIEVEQNSLRPRSPGMKYKHYAPMARITLYEGSLQDIVFCITRDIKQRQKNKDACANDNKIGILASEQSAKLYDSAQIGAEILIVGDIEKPATIAANLFRVLRQFDDIGVTEVYAESFDDTNVGAAVMNRLKKAAGANVRRCAVKRIVFVCSGNTCRSPMAEALAKKIFWDKDIVFSSRGVRAMGGMPISPNARQTLLQEYDIDFADHLSALLTEEDLNEADLVLTMTAAHKRAIESEYPGHNNVELFMDYMRGIKKDVSDPFGGDLKCYMDCAAEINLCLLNAADIFQPSV